MKKRSLFRLLCVLNLTVLGTSYSFAHTALSEATPADGAMVMETPENLQLSFNEEVRLLKALVTLGEEEIEIDFTPSATASKHFTVALPKLEHGRYSVAWAVLGADSHRVEGNLSFMVGMMGHQGEHGNAENAVHGHQTGHDDTHQTSHDH
ncbi:MAG: copper resistance protein CopC [Gammaproteobacteria bacterium]